MRVFSLFAISCVVLFSCGGGGQEKKMNSPATPSVSVPAFSSDSAFAYVDRQVKFGPRVPNSKAHNEAGDYIIKTLKRSGAAVQIQSFEATTFDGQILGLRNIIASYNPEKQKRILLASHWDTRPFADKDSVNKNARFDGANDGASGVGILLEVARQIAKQKPSAGIDIIFFDGEDWGERDKDFGKVPKPEGVDSWWCLGSQYWAKHKHKGNYTAYYGILLDMAGAQGAHFYEEGTSYHYAPKVMENVWNTAERLGYSAYFVKQKQSAIEDDHVFVNEIANIPMIDIVDYRPDTGYFGPYHHSLKDNINIISKETLGVTGTVLMNVIYYEE